MTANEIKQKMSGIFFFNPVAHFLQRTGLKQVNDYSPRCKKKIQRREKKTTFVLHLESARQQRDARELFHSHALGSNRNAF